MAGGSDLNGVYGNGLKWGHHEWSALWKPDQNDKHVAGIQMSHAFKFFNKVSLMTMHITAKQVSPIHYGSFNFFLNTTDSYPLPTVFVRVCYRNL